MKVLKLDTMKKIAGGTNGCAPAPCAPKPSNCCKCS